MLQTRIVMITPEAAEKRRAEVIKRVGGDEAALRERAGRWELNAEELVAYDELRALDFLYPR